MNPWEVLRAFIDRTDRVLALLDGFMPECRWLHDGETLTYLHSTISTNRHRVRVPEVPMHLDALLADLLQATRDDQAVVLISHVRVPESLVDRTVRIAHGELVR